MKKSITQATQNDKQISKSIKRYFTRFHVSSALKASNAYKKKGYSGNGDFSVSVSADFFQQKHVYESAYRPEYSGFCEGYRLSFHEDGSD